MTRIVERCRKCDQLTYQCVCNEPHQSLAEWLHYGRGRGWIGPIHCDTHNGIPMSEEEAEAYDAGEEPCIFVLRFYTHPSQTQQTQQKEIVA